MMRRTPADVDPTGNQAVANVLRAQEAHADLGLGYPPDDDTEDLRPEGRVSDATPVYRTETSRDKTMESIPDTADTCRSEYVSGSSGMHCYPGYSTPPDSKKPPVSSAKNITEGNQTTTQQEVNPS